MSQPHKICPRCQTPAAVDAQFCSRCGHGYRTQFQQDQTVLGAPQPPYQAPYQPPPPPGYPYGQQPPSYGPRPDFIQVAPGTHSSVTAMLMTLLIVGAGQWYNKQIIKGVVLLVVSMALLVITGCLAVFVIYPVAMIDAYQVGARLNRGEPVGQWQWF